MQKEDNLKRAPKQLIKAYPKTLPVGTTINFIADQVLLINGVSLVYLHKSLQVQNQALPKICF